MYEPLDSYMKQIDDEESWRDAWALQCEIKRLVADTGLDMTINLVNAMIAEAVAAEFQALEELPY